MRRIAAGVVICLAGCSLSTVPGPLWNARGGDVAPPLCVYAGDFTYSGDTWLRQRARESLLARAATSRAQCEVRRIRVDVDEIAVAMNTDAYGPAAGRQKSSAPQPARMQVVLSGRLRWVPCGGLTEHIQTIRVDEWMPWTGDPYLAEERAGARLEPLADRWWDQAALLIARRDCARAEKRTADDE